jgi:glutathione S-transferase
MLPDGSIMTETAAMLLHIADAHPAARLAPPPGTPARAQHDRWLVFLAVNVYEGELRKMYGERYTADGEGREGVGAAARAYVDRHYALVEQALGDGPYFFGDDLSMVDIYLWTFANWHDTAWVEANCPKIARLVQTVQARPKIAPIQAENYGP